ASGWCCLRSIDGSHTAMPGGPLLIHALIVATALAAPPLPTYQVEGSLTSATFIVQHLGILKQRGQFERVSGTIVLDSAKQTGSIDFVLDGTSVNTGWDVRDDFIRGDSMF